MCVGKEHKILYAGYMVLNLFDIEHEFLESPLAGDKLSRLFLLPRDQPTDWQ